MFILVPSNSSIIEAKLSNRSFVARYKSIADEFNLSTSDVEKQYELALKNRLEISPILMRQLIVDAVGILRIIVNEFNHDMEKNHERSQRLSKHLTQLEILHKLFDQHC